MQWWPAIWCLQRADGAMETQDNKHEVHDKAHSAIPVHKHFPLNSDIST